MDDEQQIRFKKMIPKVHHVLTNHWKILTYEEIELLDEYATFISNGATEMSRFKLEEAETIVKYLSRL